MKGAASCRPTLLVEQHGRVTLSLTTFDAPFEGLFVRLAAALNGAAVRRLTSLDRGD